MKVLGINAIFHDPAAALVVDGVTVAAAEEERFSRRKHGKRPVPCSAGAVPAQAAPRCRSRRREGLGPPERSGSAPPPSSRPSSAPGTTTELSIDTPTR